MKYRIIIFLLSWIFIISSLMVFFHVETVIASGKTLYVGGDEPGNYSTIQNAINDANIGDTVFVYSGVYFENILIDISITLIGEDKNTTIINGNGTGIVVNVLADYVRISGFTIMNGGPLAQEFDAGLKIESNYNHIYDCNISSNNYFGLYLYSDPDVSNNTIKFNTFFNNSYGLYGYYAKTNKIFSNTFKSNTDYGIFLIGPSDDNLISSNKFIGNNYAVRIKGSSLNKIIKNIIISNIHGIYFCCGANNNIAYSNVFINNINWNANDAANNKWDNGTIGNYWDDYTGLDEDGDGIGDTPYNIPGGSSKDNYPLIEPVSDNIPPVIKIINPTKGYFHFSGIKMFPTFLRMMSDTIGFGGFRLRPIQVQVQDNIDSPEYLNVYMFVKEDEQGEMTWNSTKNLFERKWIGSDIGVYKLNITAEDTSGNIGYTTIELWYLCFIPE